MPYQDTFVESATGFQFEWRVPGKPLSVAVTSAVVTKLRQGCSSFSPVGGGLLLGEVVPGEYDRVYVADCVPLAWDREREGAPFLTDTQRRNLDEKIAAAKQIGMRGLAVVGYYRTDHAQQPTLAEADVDLLDRYFPKATDLCLLVLRRSGGLTGVVFLRKEGSFQPGDSNCSLELPLYRLELRATSVRKDPIARRQRLLTTAAWLVGLALVAIMSRGLWPRSARNHVPQRDAATGPEGPDPFVSAVAAASSPVELGLKLSDEGLHLSWNPRVATVKSARCGVLTIEESGYRRNIPLQRKDLEQGGYSYHPTGGNVTFHMDVLTLDDRLVSSNLHFLDGTGPDSYSPPTAHFAPPPELLNPAEGSPRETISSPVRAPPRPALANSGQIDGLCAVPPPPTPGGKPRRIVSARAIGGPAFALPSDAQPLRHEVVYISVNVFLDEWGSVLDAQVPASLAYSHLCRFLLQRVRQWRYSPATLDGSPAASSVKFDFTIRAGR